MRLTRRKVLFGGVVAVASGGAVFASRWFNVFADVAAEGMLSVDDALRLAESDAIYLVDIRRPDEWERTGLATPAIPLDMRRDDFEQTLRALFTAKGPRPVALICARGVRSDRMNNRLAAAGFTDILDVPEGMLGSGAGPGYLKRNLPLRAPTAQELSGEIL